MSRIPDLIIFACFPYLSLLSPTTLMLVYILTSSPGTRNSELRSIYNLSTLYLVSAESELLGITSLLRSLCLLASFVLRIDSAGLRLSLLTVYSSASLLLSSLVLGLRPAPSDGP